MPGRKAGITRRRPGRLRAEPNESGNTYMGISHDYHGTGRSRRGGPGGVIRFAGAVAGILLVSFAITAILEHGQAQPEELPTVTANGTAQNILAPLPMQGAADSTTDSAVSGGENAAADGTPAVTLEQFGPARQIGRAHV